MLTITSCIKDNHGNYRKSSYGKSSVYTCNDGTRLVRSYTTIVAMIMPDGTIRKTWSDYSRTTSEHLSGAGVNKSKKEWENMPLFKVPKKYMNALYDFLYDNPIKYKTSDNWMLGYNQYIM